MIDRPRSRPDPDWPAERKGFLSLVPRRNLVKVVMLLLILVVVVVLQRRTGSIVRRLGDVLGAAAPARIERPPPRVRLAPPPAPPVTPAGRPAP